MDLTPISRHHFPPTFKECYTLCIMGKRYINSFPLVPSTPPPCAWITRVSCYSWPFIKIPLWPIFPQCQNYANGWILIYCWKYMNYEDNKNIHKIILTLGFILSTHSPIWAIHKVHKSEDHSSKLRIKTLNSSPWFFSSSPYNQPKGGAN